MAGKRRGVRHKKSSGGRAAQPPPLRYIPMDVWTEILIRTSAEDLVRFKGVCKAWYELISRRSFAESHLEHLRSRPVNRILFDMDTPVDARSWKTTKSDIFYSSNVNHMGSLTEPTFGDHSLCRSSLLTSRQRAKLGCGSKELKILASCDGLILICCYADRAHYQLLICNPITGSHRKLPVFQPTGTRFWSSSEWVVLRSASGQYKVCKIGRRGAPRQRERERERMCYILELQIGTKEQPERQWKERMVPLSNDWTIEATTTKDGKVHWLANRDDKYCVLSLDILKDEYTSSVSIKSPCGRESRRVFPWKGAFYLTAPRQSESSLWVLENFDTMTWTEYRFAYDPDFLYLPGERPTVVGDNNLLLGWRAVNLMSREFWRLDFPSLSSSHGSIKVLHTDSLIECN